MLITLFKFYAFKMKSLTTLTTLFYFTTIKMKSLTTLTALFKFATIKMKSLTTLNTLFYFNTIKAKSLSMLTTLFYFTTINPRYGSTVAALLLFFKYFSSHEFQCFDKICLCHSNFTVKRFLHALLPQTQYRTMKWVLKLCIPSSLILGSNWENFKHIELQPNLPVWL